MVLFSIFFFIVIALNLLAASYWVKAEGNIELAGRIQEAGGVFTFVFCLLGWYLELSLMLLSMDFPFELPVFDLSTKIRGAREKGEAGKEA